MTALRAIPGSWPFNLAHKLDQAVDRECAKRDFQPVGIDWVCRAALDLSEQVLVRLFSSHSNSFAVFIFADGSETTYSCDEV